MQNWVNEVIKNRESGFGVVIRNLRDQILADFMEKFLMMNSFLNRVIKDRTVVNLG